MLKDKENKCLLNENSFANEPNIEEVQVQIKS